MTTASRLTVKVRAEDYIRPPAPREVDTDIDNWFLDPDEYPYRGFIIRNEEKPSKWTIWSIDGFEGNWTSYFKAKEFIDRYLKDNEYGS